MCSKPKAPKVEKADPVAPPPPVLAAPIAPVLNEKTAGAEGNTTSKRKGRSALTIPLTSAAGSGVNVPR